jgi:hypothetical protein
MRKVLFGILMAATAAMPAVAQAQDSDSREGRRAEARSERAREHYEAQGERNEARSERRQEAQTQNIQRQQVRQERVEAPVQQQQQQQQQQQSWAGRRGGDGQRSQAYGGGQRNQSWGGGDRSGYRRDVEASREASQRSADQTIGGNYARQAQRNQQRYEQQGRRDGRDWNRDGSRDNRWSDNQSSRRGSWNRNWRGDNRYDWQRYRYSNRNLFRSGGYYAPYRGYSYNRLNIGFILDSLFYSNRYWLSDPYQYRLPAAPYGTQWVRYYDDVVLVDVYTGEVLDVIYDFFW